MPIHHQSGSVSTWETCRSPSLPSSTILSLELTASSSKKRHFLCDSCLKRETPMPSHPCWKRRLLSTPFTEAWALCHLTVRGQQRSLWPECWAVFMVHTPGGELHVRSDIWGVTFSSCGKPSGHWPSARSRASAEKHRSLNHPPQTLARLPGVSRWALNTSASVM